MWDHPPSAASPRASSVSRTLTRRPGPRSPRPRDPGVAVQPPQRGVPIVDAIVASAWFTLARNRGKKTWWMMALRERTGAWCDRRSQPPRRSPPHPPIIVNVGPLERLVPPAVVEQAGIWTAIPASRAVPSGIARWTRSNWSSECAGLDPPHPGPTV